MTTTEPPNSGQGGGGQLDESGVRRIVSDVLGGLFSSGKAKVGDGGPPAPRRGSRAENEASITEQVNAALADAQAKRDREQQQAEQQSAFAALQGDVTQLKAAVEKPPAQTRRIERIMRWGE